MDLLDEARQHAHEHPDSADIIGRLIDHTEALTRTIRRVWTYGEPDWAAELADDEAQRGH